jgi:hypothetical protein
MHDVITFAGQTILPLICIGAFFLVGMLLFGVGSDNDDHLNLM